MIISLLEILNDIQAEEKNGLIALDDWRIIETDHLDAMGFKAAGPHHMALDNPPMVVYKKKNGMFLKDGKKNKHFRFEDFNKLVEYFDHYQQEDLRK